MSAAETSLADLAPMLDSAFDALEAGRIEEFVEITKGQVHPDCTFRSGIGSVVGGGEYEGLEGLRAWFSDFISTTAERRWANRRYETYGEDVIVFLSDLEFTGAASGATVVSETGAVFRYEDGLCVRIESFMSHDEARRFAEAQVA